MDFRTPQLDAARFAYVLPFDARHALVDYVTCGAVRPGRAFKELQLRTYISQVLGLDVYTIVGRESGASPLVGREVGRKASAHVMCIGIAGGHTKASTGYAFARILRDSASISLSLDRTGKPFYVARDSARHQRYDRVLLDLIRRRPELVPLVLEALFTRNSLDTVFRFLDESSTYLDELRVAASLPVWFSLSAIVPPRSMPWLRVQPSL
jgi:lycopene beta-cyclase